MNCHHFFLYSLIFLYCLGYLWLLLYVISFMLAFMTIRAILMRFCSVSDGYLMISMINLIISWIVSELGFLFGFFMFVVRGLVSLLFAYRGSLIILTIFGLILSFSCLIHVNCIHQCQCLGFFMIFVLSFNIFFFINISESLSNMISFILFRVWNYSLHTSFYFD